MKFLFFALGALTIPITSQAAYTVKEGKLINMNELATLSVQEHYSLVKEALETENWAELIKQARIVVKNFPSSAFALDSYFYLGVGYFHLHELEMANENFSLYLKKQTAPKFFEEAIEYKFSIAEQFQKGAKRRLLGQEGLPKWFSARRDAISIYEEVIAALPQHDLAVRSLFGKATVLFDEEDFKESIETFQVLLRRFPKHPLACDSYVAITRVYRVQGEKEYADPDYLDLAEINVKKFKSDFPGNPKIEEAELLLAGMKEIYAKELYNTAQFYERTKKTKASLIYYSKIITKYPGTEIADKSQKRLAILQEKQGEFKQEGTNLTEFTHKEGVIVDSRQEPEEDIR